MTILTRRQQSQTVTPNLEKGYLRAFDCCWNAVADRNTYLVIEPRDVSQFSAAANMLLEVPPFSRIVAGHVSSVLSQIQDLPAEIFSDIEELAMRFAELTGSDRVRVRLEQIVTNSCRKVHADYTDLRLITTYAGPGTQIAAGNDPDAVTLLDVPAGHIGLFKGRRYDASHEPCYHRSPPAADMGVKRLVLVIDTETFVSDGECG